MTVLMNKFNRLLRNLNSFLGLLTIAIFSYALWVFITLKPKMLAYESLTHLEENLMTGVGLGLILILIYFLLSLLQIVRAVRDAESLRLFPLVMILFSVVAILLVFSDVALLRDIHKQFQEGLAQPEWALLFPIMGGQFLLSLILAYLHFSGYFLKTQSEQPARDINIFLVVQYVGVVCGLLGLGFSSLGFFFPHAWSLQLHTVWGGLILIFPYGLVVIYWVILNLREKERKWWDEKQSQDVGKSAMITLALDTILLLSLFIVNYPNLCGSTHLLWLPLYLFGTITFLSVGNLLFSSRL
jgi:hypothetical protein